LLGLFGVVGGGAHKGWVSRFPVVCVVLFAAFVGSSVSAASGQLVEQAELVGPGTNGSQFGGHGMALSLSAAGDTALIGESVKGDAFVYTRSGSEWSRQASLSPPHSGEQYGFSVALSADGNTAIGTSFGFGAWVYARSGATWTLQTEEPLVAAEGEDGGMYEFGESVAISSDGATAVVGAVAQAKEGNSACAWVFRRSGSRWARVAMLKPAGETIFSAHNAVWPAKVSIAGDGRTVLVANSADSGGTGGAWIFEEEAGGSWGERTRLEPSGELGPGGFGSGVSLSRDGSTALVGARHDAYGGGGAWAFTRGKEGWRAQGQELIPLLEPLSGGFGESVALSADGTAAMIGGPNNGSSEISPGAAWLFRRTGERWWLEQKLPDPVPRREASTGMSVSVSAEATTALVASPGQGTEGAAWIFTGPSTPGSEMAPAPPAIPAGGQWAGLGGDPARTATVDSSTLHPPFKPYWSRSFAVPAGTAPRKTEEDGEEVELPNEEVIGYPLLGNGLVYFVRSNTGNPEKPELDAVSQQTGATVWSRELASNGTFIAIDGNRLFAAGGDPEGLIALDALTGQELWHRDVEAAEPLVASEGVLYYVDAFIGAETLAVDETTGRTKWEGKMFDDVASGPVLGDGRVYVMGSLGQNTDREWVPSGWAWDAKTGARLWEDAPEGQGDRGSSWTTVLAEGRLWTANSGAGTEFSEWVQGGIVDPATGAQLGTYDAMNVNSPIVDGGDVLALAEHWECPRGLLWSCHLASTTLTSKDAGGKVLWTFQGDGRLDSGLVRIGDDVLVGSASGNLYAIDQSSGTEVWKAAMPAGFRAEALSSIGAPTGIAANGNMLAVPTGDTLTLLTSADAGAPSEPSAPAGEAPPLVPSPVTGEALSPSLSPTPRLEVTRATPPTSTAATGVAGSRASATPGCVLAGTVRKHRLRGGAMRIGVTVRCSTRGKLTLVAGYRARAGGRRDTGLVVLGRTTTHVPRGRSTVGLTLAGHAARSLATRGPLRVGLSLSP
jgi:outer membrane protein assembly factor BamB